jgi:5-methylcytosine-specific restriction endonuclease McrA
MTVAVRRCLILNADYRPITTFPPQIEHINKAVKKVLKGRADIVADWGVLYSSENTTMMAPKVIVLRNFVHVYGKPKFNRHGILLRDDFRCQYCGEKFPSSELTYDHVKPRSKGGKTVWENIATACLRCNGKKSNRTCAEAGMYPKQAPFAPTAHQLMEAGLRNLDPAIRQTWGEWLYWHVELEQE